MKKRHFKAPSGETISFTELGFGTAPVGNLYKATAPEEAQRTLEAAWKAGIRYYDTAPLYGLGLSETRLNRFLFGKKRKDYVLSTKVGRLLEVCDPKQRTGIGKFFDTPSRREIYDYSYDGFMRSIEFSLERLGVDSIDVIFIHDVDVFNHKTVAARDAHVKTILKSGIKALEKLRSEKVIKAFGAGVNEWEVCETLARNSDVDIFLLAGRYTLLEQDSLNSFLPLCEERGIGIVLGGPYNSGILATGPVGFLLGPAIGVASLIRQISRADLRKATLWLAVSGSLACGFYAFLSEVPVFGLGLMLITIAVGVALFVHMVRRLEPPKPVVVSGVILLAGAVLMLGLSLFPPVVAPWWGKGPDAGAPLPAFAFVFDPGFDASRHVPRYVIDRPLWGLEMLLVAALVAGGLLLVKILAGSRPSPDASPPAA
jgi:D-threo-aldose 1-dehydrogenase